MQTKLNTGRSMFLVFMLLFALQSFGQRWRELGVLEVGPMFNYQHTSLFAAKDVYAPEGEGRTNKGFEPNYAAGLYLIYYFKPKIGLGAELYYDRVSSSSLPEDEHYNSLTFMGYVNYDPFKFMRNFYLGAGLGASFIQEAPDYDYGVTEEDIRVITLPLKLSATYRIRNEVSFELGANVELIEVVSNKVRRNFLFAGMKIPLNRILGGYR